MPATILDGRAIASQVWAETKERAAALAARGLTPRLAVVHVGDDPSAAAYLRQIARSFRANGLEVADVTLAAEVGQAGVEEALRKLGAEPDTHGILLQAPLPKGLSLERAAEHLA